jgi:hypothetical protein
MLSMADTQKRFSVQLDDDAHALLKALAYLDDVQPAALAREMILDRLRVELERSGDDLRAMLRLAGHDPDTMRLPGPGAGSDRQGEEAGAR